MVGVFFLFSLDHFYCPVIYSMFVQIRIKIAYGTVIFYFLFWPDYSVFGH